MTIWKKVLILFLIGFLFPQSVFAQQVAVPTIYCLGSCPLPSSAATPTIFNPTIQPTATQIPVATTQPTNAAPSSSPTPTVSPCATESSASVQTNRKYKKKYKRGGGFIARFFRFLFRLIEMILRGGGQFPTPTNPDPTATPSATPTIDPCITPTQPETPSITPSVTQNPTITTVIQPTTTQNTSCTNPVWTSADPNGMYETNGYFVHNNMWNTSANPGPQTTYVCAFNNWYVISNQINSAGAVKTYPNVHKDFNNLNGTAFSSFNTITTTFAATAPKVGIYNVAYDLWLNGVGWGGGSTEFMIWTENFGQTPLGNKQESITFSGQVFDSYYYNDGNANVVTLVAKSTMNSGSFNLKEMISWGISKGWVPANPTVNQIGFGVEVVSTNGTPATFKFTDFSVTAN